MELGGSISGPVLKQDTGEKIAGLWVDACYENVSLDMWGSYPLCKGAETDENGFYTITHLSPGKYRVVTWGTDDFSLQFYNGVAQLLRG